MPKLYTDTPLFYMRDLSIYEESGMFGGSGGCWNQFSTDTEGEMHVPLDCLLLCNGPKSVVQDEIWFLFNQAKTIDFCLFSSRLRGEK